MRKPADLLVILTSAVLTLLVAVPILAPAPSHAEGEGVSAAVQNGSPAPLWAFMRKAPTGEPEPIVTDGLEVTLILDQESYQAGEKPVLTLVAINKQDKKCRTKARIVMSSTEPSSPMSRSMPMPVAVFTREVEIEVLAGQTLVLPLETGHAVAAKNMISVTLTAGEQAALVGSFAVAAPEGDAGADEVIVVQQSRGRRLQKTEPAQVAETVEGETVVLK